MAVPRYRYDTLPGGREPVTRLLNLLPGDYGSPICCFLQTVDVTKNDLPYEALSYVWGSEMASNPVLCHPGQISVTANLDRALRQLRQIYVPRRLWVDALCINQENVKERSRQVRYMRLVYKHASRVVVWLGPKVPGVDKAFESVRTLTALLDDLEHNIPDYAQRPFLMRDDGTELANIMLESLAADPAVDDVVALYQRDYFERAWCVQEVVVSATGVALCEELEIDLFRLLRLAKYVDEHRGYRFPTGTLQYWNAVLESRRRRQQRQGADDLEGSMGPILTLLMSGRDFQSTDPRDRLYAFLGISDEGIDPIKFVLPLPTEAEMQEARAQGVPTAGLERSVQLMRWLERMYNRFGMGGDYGVHERPALTPDYEKPVKDVYREFARVFFIKRLPGSLDILDHVQHTRDPLGESSWPSWIPRFSEPRSASYFAKGFYMSGVPYAPATPFRADIQDTPVRGDPREPDILVVGGFKVDQVQAVSDVMRFDLNSNPPVQNIWDQLFSFPLVPRPNQKYVVGNEGLDTAFFSALAGGPISLFRTIVKMAAGEPQRPNRLESFKILSLHLKFCVACWWSLKRAPDDEAPTPYTDLVDDPALTPDLQMDMCGQEEWYMSCFFRAVWSICQNRRVYRTSSGLLGLGPQVMQPGDTVAVLSSGEHPFILRRHGADWVLIGDTYLHHKHIMMGMEMTAVMASRGPFKMETFRIK